MPARRPLPGRIQHERPRAIERRRRAPAPGTRTRSRLRDWKRWGPYLSERQWGTVREDYSRRRRLLGLLPARPRAQPRLPLGRGRPARASPTASAGCASRSRCGTAATRSSRSGCSASPAPRAITARTCKECYFYLDATPTHSYLKALYKYPQAEFPYDQLRRGEPPPRPDASRSSSCSTPASSTRTATSTSFVEYAKAAPDDILIRITVANRGPEAATLHLLPTLWFRNTWSWGCTHEGCWPKPRHRRGGDGRRLRPSTRRWARSASSPSRSPTARARVPVHRERDQRRAALRRAERDALRQGRLSRVRRPRRDATRSIRKQRGTKAAAHYRARRSGRRTQVASGCGCLPTEQAPRQPFGADVRSTSSRDRIARGRRVLRGAHRRRRCTTTSAASRGRPTRAALDQAVLPLRRRGLARGRSGAAAAARSARKRAATTTGRTSSTAT